MNAISVIIPVYNVENYILDCLKSITKQSLQQLEIIIVDDCGEDNSMNIVYDFVKNYHGEMKFKILHQKQNLGLSAARNLGIKASTSPWIYFIDSDDQIDKTCLETLYQYATEEKEMIQANFSLIVNGKESDTISFSYETQLELDIEEYIQLYKNRAIQWAAWNRLLKREWICQHELYFENGLYCEDVLWSFRLLGYLNHITLLSNRTYYYIHNPKSIMGRVETEETISIHNKKAMKVYLDQVLITDIMLSYIKTDTHYQKESIITFYNKIRYHFLFDKIRSLKIQKVTKYKMLCQLVKTVFGFNYNRLPLQDHLTFIIRYIYMKLYIILKSL